VLSQNANKKYQISRMYGYVRARQLEGTFNSDPTTGVYISSANRIQKGWGALAEEEWPYDGDASNWPPKQEPKDADQLAKKNRILAYQRTRTLTDVKRSMAMGRGVIASFEIDLSAWRNSKQGHIPMPSSNSSMDGAHCVTLVGYDDNSRQVEFANSWGVHWGDRGFGTIPYSYFEKFQTEAWILITQFEIEGLRDSVGTSRTQVVSRGFSSFLDEGLVFVFEIKDHMKDEMAAWAIVVEKDGFADIEEFFVKPTYRRRGYSAELIESIRQSPIAQKPKRLWVPHSDANILSRPKLEMLATRLELKLTSSQRRWSPLVAM
jgi:Papain family cysteine protease